MLPQARDLASGSFVPSNPSIVGCRTRAGLPYLLPVSSSGGGLFKRPVILWIRGAFYFLPGSFENIGTSSLFPDDKLR